MNKVILITGISSGFGKETAKLLAARGHTVYGTLRKEAEKIDKVNVLQLDLTNYDSIKKAVKSVLVKEGRIDVLINNAGAHTGGPVETAPDEHIRLQMETNFLGMVRLTKEVLPIMREQGQGRIINFSSIGGLMGLPFQGFYSASKFAIEGFSEALRMEIARFKIKVVVINPGDFHTSNSANRRNFLAPSTPGDPWHDHFRKSLSIIEHDESHGWDPSVLAKKIARIVETRYPKQRYIIASFEQKLAVLLKYILPAKWFMKILASHYGLILNPPMKA
ncbi:MAG: SDR family oxidoreductase [Bacteroidota bacterium]|nr:SDR family oxidoreductase [Bacteroidota bacterium]